ncbi:MAG: hypothetical protein KBC46_03460 [Ferrovibrio sp.]|nr:hypothetical protein [Ferrovibrio sp.]
MLPQSIVSLSMTETGTDFTIGAAGSYVSRPVKDLYGLQAADVSVYFAGGAGGTSVKAYIQTSLDQGTSWIDLYSFAALTSAKRTAVSLRPGGAIITPSDGALADDSLAAGIVLGPELRTKLIVAGNFTGSPLLVVRAALR